jgi:hypothetical protein
MILNYDRFFEQVTHYWMKEQASGVFRDRIANSFLRPQISVDLIEVSVAQSFIAVFYLTTVEDYRRPPMKPNQCIDYL